MLMKDSSAVTSGAYRSTSRVVQPCLTPRLLSTRSKAFKYKYVKDSNKVIEIMTRKSAKISLNLVKGLV